MAIWCSGKFKRVYSIKINQNNFFLKWLFTMACICLNRKIFYQLHLEIVDFHKRFKHKEILFTYIKILRICNNIFCCFGVASILACVLYPIMDSLFMSKKLVLGFGFLIPYTNHEKWFGYILNFIFQNIQVVVLGFGYITFIRVYWLFFAHACVKSDILRSTLEDFNGHIGNDSYDEEQNQEMELRLKKCVQFHIEYLRFYIKSFSWIKLKQKFIISVL